MNDNSQNDNYRERLESGPSEVFSPNHYPELMKIKLQDPVLQGLPEFPLFTISLASVGIIFIFSGLVSSVAKSPVPSAGVLVLALSLPVFLAERFIIWRTIKKRSSSMYPCVEELKLLRNNLSLYLSDLDKRTMRYFHCVTNSKVTTYFMLRQIENAMAELLVEFDKLYSEVSQKNLFQTQSRLKGSLEYRDGFVFNSGRLLHCPVAFLPSRIHELVSELERGINTLEAEIENFRQLAAKNQM